ncbi:MAG TPA: ArsB/NhaD family transporter, partial [Solirubrobacteraceae bacterium]|nr:ArsB/NhaD family transporter [Solirubrobacteraceae bacterium]
PAVARGELGPHALAHVAQPNLVALVLGLGVLVAAASEHGVGELVGTLLPDGDGLLALLGVAALAALLANLVNNLPATLVVIPIAAAAGPASVLAALIGLNAGPNLTPTGSLATLLWRRVARGTDGAVPDARFVRLGAVATPVVVVAATTALWLAFRLGA